MLTNNLESVFGFAIFVWVWAGLVFCIFALFGLAWLVFGSGSMLDGFIPCWVLIWNTVLITDFL